MKDLITVFEVDVMDRNKNIIESMNRAVYRCNSLRINGIKIDNSPIDHNADTGRRTVGVKYVGTTKKIYYITTKTKTQHLWNWKKPMGERKEKISGFIST